MFDKIFGKRTKSSEKSGSERFATTSRLAAPYATPKARRDGGHGDFLLRSGMTGDDDLGLVSLSPEIQSEFDRLLEEEQSFVAQVNRRLACEVRPWAMIPHPCWQGEHSSFLLSTLKVFPVGEWNTLLLPKDDRGALLLDLPKHPMGVDLKHVAAANRLIGEVRQRVQAKHREAVERRTRGDGEGIFSFAAVVENASADLSGLAFRFASKIFGERALNRNREMFYGGR
jgi:hypothetical protein